MKSKQTILFAEDSESDMILIQLGFERVGFPFQLQFVPDGISAIDYLSRQGRYADRARFPCPCVLLTDLKMPKMDGFGLLAWVRSQEQWQNLPVIVVTGSNQPEDWQRAMDLGANSYVVKELLMRPPPTLFEAILRYASPAPERQTESCAESQKKLGRLNAVTLPQPGAHKALLLLHRGLTIR